MNILFGYGGHADEILNNFKYLDISIKYFIVEDSYIPSKKNNTIITEKDFIEKHYLADTNAYIGIGSSMIRKKIFNKFQGFKFPNLHHADSLLSLKTFREGFGNIIFYKAYLSTNILLGNFNHINIGATISHDFTCGNFNTISPNVCICGKVSLGDNIFIGAGSTIIDNISICSDTVIGAGSIVVKNIVEPGVYFGNPIKRIR